MKDGSFESYMKFLREKFPVHDLYIWTEDKAGAHVSWAVAFMYLYSLGVTGCVSDC